MVGPLGKNSLLTICTKLLQRNDYLTKILLKSKKKINMVQVVTYIHYDCDVISVESKMDQGK